MRIEYYEETVLGFHMNWILKANGKEVKHVNLKTAFKNLCKVTNKVYTEEAWVKWRNGTGLTGKKHVE